MVPMTALMTGEAFGMWIMGGVFERFPGLKVVFVEPGPRLGRVVADIVDDMVTRQGYKSRPSPSCPASTSTATCS